MLQSGLQGFYAWQSLGTLSGAAGCVLVVSNTVRKLLKIDSPWIPFIAAVLLVYVGAFTTHHLASLSDWALAFLNSCLLFCTAAGGNQVLVEAKPRPVAAARPYGARPVAWLSPWLKRV